MNTSQPPSLSGSLEFLAFTLGKEEYGIDIQKVQELRGYDTVTPVSYTHLTLPTTPYV